MSNKKEKEHLEIIYYLAKTVKTLSAENQRLQDENDNLRRLIEDYKKICQVDVMISE